VVLTRAPARLLVFDSTGPLLHATSTTTRGESDDSAALQLIGDTVLVWEPAERRIQTFTPDGHRSVTSWTETAAHARFRLPDGTLAGVAPGPDPPPPSGIRRPRHYVLRYHPGDSPADTLREVSGEPLWIQPGASGPQSWRLPFGPVPAIGFDANHVYVACEDDAFRYDVLDWTGLVARRVQVETAPPPVTEEDAAAYREAWSRWAMTRGSAYSARFGDLPSAILFRDRRPACSDVRISTDHRVWIAEYVQLDAVPREWTVFGADGALLGRVRVPEGLRLTHVTADRAVAIQTAPGGDRVLLFRLPSLD
jgi:hypothetical protein